MRVLVVGAHHGTGPLVMAEAVAKGYLPTAFEGDVLDEAVVARQTVGHDAVISLLGPRRGEVTTTVCSQGTANLLAAMGPAGVRRLVVVTGAMVGHPRARLGLFYRGLVALIPQAPLQDRRRSEALVQHSDTEWTIVRPTRLTDASPSAALQVGSDLLVPALARVSRLDVARFVVAVLADPTWRKRAVTLIG